MFVRRLAIPVKLLVFCSMTAFVFAQAPPSITIEQAVQEALQKNPGLLAEKQQQKKKRQAAGTVSARRFVPRLSRAGGKEAP